MKVIGIIGAVIVCVIAGSEILSLAFLLVGGIAFLCKVGGENPHGFF